MNLAGETVGCGQIAHHQCELPDIFGNGREQIRQRFDTEKNELYKQIGQLKVELDFLKKRAGLIE